MKIKLPNISFEVSHECNLNCLYCYNHWKYDNNKLSIPNSYKQAKKTLKKILYLYGLENSSLVKMDKINGVKLIKVDLAKIEEANMRLRHSEEKLAKFFSELEIS